MILIATVDKTNPVVPHFILQNILEIGCLYTHIITKSYILCFL